MEKVSLVNLDDKKNMWLTPNACSLRFSQVGFKWLQVVNNCCRCFCCVWRLATPWTVVCLDPLPMEFSSQRYWSGVLFPTPGDLPYPGIEPRSLVSPALASGFFTTNATWENQISSLFPLLFSVKIVTRKLATLKNTASLNIWIL